MPGRLLSGGRGNAVEPVVTIQDWVSTFVSLDPLDVFDGVRSNFNVCESDTQDIFEKETFLVSNTIYKW